MPGDRECRAPDQVEMTIMKVSEQYRLKALACEKLALEVPNYDFKCAWTDLAVEWHLLANRAAEEGVNLVVSNEKSRRIAGSDGWAR